MLLGPLIASFYLKGYLFVREFSSEIEIEIEDTQFKSYTRTHVAVGRVPTVKEKKCLCKYFKKNSNTQIIDLIKFNKLNYFNNMRYK